MSPLDEGIDVCSYLLLHDMKCITPSKDRNQRVYLQRGGGGLNAHEVGPPAESRDASWEAW